MRRLSLSLRSEKMGEPTLFERHQELCSKDMTLAVPSDMSIGQVWYPVIYHWVQMKNIIITELAS